MTDPHTQPDAGRQDRDEGNGPAPGAAPSLPEAEDLTRDRPALASSATGDDLPVAKPVDTDAIPVAEEVAPPPTRKTEAPRPAGKAPPAQKAKAGDEAPRKSKAEEPPALKAQAEEPPAPKTQTADGQGPAEPTDRSEAPDRPRGHWRRRIVLAAAALLLLVIVFLPQILSLGPVRRAALDYASRRLPVRVEADDWSLSWFGGQTVDGLRVRSAEGEPVATVRRVMLRTGLVSLALNARRLGPVEVEKAEVWVDDLRAALAAAEAGPEAAPEVPPEVPPEPPEVPPEAPPVPEEVPAPAEPEPAEAEPGPAPMVPESIDVNGLVLHVGGDRLTVPEAGLRPDGDRHAFDARLEVVRGEREGACTVQGMLTGLVADWQGADRVGVEARVTCEALPLAAAAGVAGTGLELAGTLDGEATVARDRHAVVRVDVDLTATDLEVAGEPLGEDRPFVETLHLVADGTYAGGAVTVGSLVLSSPVAVAEAVGTFGLGATHAPLTGKGSGEIRLDLARLAGMLRHTLGLHEGLEMEDGTFEASVEAVSTETASRVRLLASLQDLRGRWRGDVLTLSPMHLDTVLVRAHAGGASGAGRDEADEEAAGDGGAARSSRAEFAPSLARTPLLTQRAGAAPPPEETAEEPPADDAEAPPAPSADWFTFADSLTVESFVLSGAFGAMEVTGRLSHLVVDGDLDLARATEEAGRFVDLGDYGAGGTASVHLETGRNLTGDVTAAGRVTLKALRVALPGGARLTDPRATLTGETVLSFDAAHRLAAVGRTNLTLDARTVSASVAGTARRAGEAWVIEGRTRGEGSVANLAGVAAVFLDRMHRRAEIAEPPQPAAEPSTVEHLLAVCRRAAGAGGTGAKGAWSLTLDVGGTTGQKMAVKADAAVTGVRLPPETEEAEPFRLETATLTADLARAPGETGAVTVNTFAAVTPAASVRIEGPATVVWRGPATRIDGSATATARADLPALAAMLRPLALVPEDLTAAGDVTVTLAVTPVTDGPTKLDMAVRGEEIDLAWDDGRGYTDPLLRASAVGTLDRDEGGAVRAIDLSEWTLATVAGALSGTIRVRPAADRWVWDATAAGDGSIQPVAHTSARLLNAEPRTLGGLWHLKASYAGADRQVEMDLALTDLTLPGRGDPPGPEVRLQDVHLEAAGSVGADGQIRIPRARLTGPGITGEASGTARLPSRDEPHPRADGKVKASVSLAEFAEVLRPFGLLSEDDRLAGQAGFAGEVRTDPTGIGGSGTLDLSELEVHLAKDKRTFREAEARLPLVFAYVNQEKRWEVAATDMSAVTAHGSWRVAVAPGEKAAEGDAAQEGPPAGRIPAPAPAQEAADDETTKEPAEPPPRLEVTCDLALDGGRVREILGSALPDTIQMAGPYHAKVRLKGPLLAEVPWHTRLAALEGEGEVEVNRFTYATLSGGEGTVRWELADGVLNLSPDPDRPSRLTVAEGTVTLPGRIHLVGPKPRLVVDKETRVVENLSLAGPEIREYLKYASPVLAASVQADGRLTLDVLRLDVPLDEEAAKTARGDLRYHIDEFRTELIGPIGRLVQVAGGEAKTIDQTLGPVAVTLRDGVFYIPEHHLKYTEAVRLAFGGRIGLDKQMKVTVGVPVTRALMTQYKVSERVMPYLEDVVLAVPLEGTLDDPRIDNRALGKRLGQLAAEAIKREALKHLGDWLKR